MPNIGTREDLNVLRFRKGGSTCYFTSGIGATAGAAAETTSDQLYGIPFFVAKTETFDRIAINITFASAGKTSRLGIYADTGLVAPGRLILDAGTVPHDATGVQEIVISQTLLGGQLYWLSYSTNQSGSGLIRVSLLLLSTHCFWA